MDLHRGFMVKALTYVIVRLTYVVHHFLQLLSAVQIHCHSSIVGRIIFIIGICCEVTLFIHTYS